MKARSATWLYLSLGVTPIVAFWLRPEMVEKKISVSSAFCQTHVAPDRRVWTTHYLSAGGSSDDNEDMEDEMDETAYGNRSLAWTNKYRKLFPYEHARAMATNLGLRCREEWNEYLDDGKVYGPYLPSRPDEMYKDDWVSWEEFLGIMRDYGDTQHIVQNVLQLPNIDEYTSFIKADPKRALGLRIPAMPHIVYKDKGWDSFDSFFNKTIEAIVE